MSEQIRYLEPKALWENFYQLTTIPRPSKNEQEAVKFIKEFSERLNLENIMDETGNIIIRKPATQGFENRKTLILQSHIDMVPQANSDTIFDFLKNPIDAFIDGEWVTARGTTLGADNGIGLAAAMAVLQSKEIEHGPLEALFTVDEETGLAGAFNLKPGLLKGDVLLNLDTEEEDVISVGCAGGVMVKASWVFSDDEIVTGDKAYKISITGLKGGHSGLDIHLGRGNSCKLMGRFLKRAIRECGCRLASINSGNLRNAIPREGVAVVTLDEAKSGKLLDLVKELQITWENELGLAEPELKIEADEVSLPKLLIPDMVQDDLVNAICAVRNGIIRISDSMPGVVETSTNLSIVESSKGKINIVCLTRSFVDSARDGVASSLESCFQLAGAKVDICGAYPGWKPNKSSEILAIVKKTFSDMRGYEPREAAMHAGLECGILGHIYPNWDMVSFGPTIKSPHSPDEKVNIESVRKFWELLIGVLKNAPVKN